MSELLRFESVSRHFIRGATTVQALQQASFVLSAGEFVALSGPSGSGKSTLLNIAGLTDTPSSGAVSIAGKKIDFTNHTYLRQLRSSTLGFVFQSFNLLASLNATENVAVSLLVNGYSWHKAEDLAREALAGVGLAERLTHFPHELSGGEMQRVALCRAIVHRPALILADEPTGSLDSHSGQQVLELLKQFQSQGAAILMATHSEKALQYVSRVLYLRDGVIAT